MGHFVEHNYYAAVAAAVFCSLDNNIIHRAKEPEKPNDPKSESELAIGREKHFNIYYTPINNRVVNYNKEKKLLNKSLT